jgi:hypothetical protein
MITKPDKDIEIKKTQTNFLDEYKHKNPE